MFLGGAVICISLEDGGLLIGGQRTHYVVTYFLKFLIMYRWPSRCLFASFHNQEPCEFNIAQKVSEGVERLHMCLGDRLCRGKDAAIAHSSARRATLALWKTVPSWIRSCESYKVRPLHVVGAC